jgi:CubicO group peptidase (beta-lactamase class C family)
MDRRDFLAAGVALPGALRTAAGATEPSAAPRPLTRVVRSDDRFEEMVRIVETTMKEHGVPAAALGVVKDGQLQMRSLGVTSVEDPRPVTDDTIFELASLSKTFNATAAMTLVERGKLDLDAPVRRVLPEFRVEDEAASAALTLRHLLSQTAGFEARYSVEEGEGALGRWVPTMGDMIQLAPPGRVWSYANPAAGLAGHMIETVTGMEIRDAFRALVFDPIGLDRATTHITELVTWPLTVGHRPGRDGKPVVVRPYSMGSSIPAGGVNASLASLMKYIAFHLGEHDGTGEGAMSRATRAKMIEAQIRKEPTGEEMGLGFHLRTLNGVKTAAHGGSAGSGHRCHLQFVPERRLGFAVLTSHTEGWRVRQAVEAPLLEAYEGLALTPNQPIIGYRGHTETLDHVTPLAKQPPVEEYLGKYRQTRTGVTEVRAAPSGGLLVGGDNGRATEIRFYGPDLAVTVNGAEPGTSYTFIRDGGRVRWMRGTGQIARKET